jgi:DNA-binding transcriptional LysR family regulator
MRRRSSRLATPTYVKDIQAFCLVVDLGSLSAVAKTFGETKGSVSRRLTRLEADLGVTLLRRSTRRVQPTEFGVGYRRLSHQALALLEDASTAVQSGLSPEGMLRVAASEGFAATVLAPAMPAFIARYPKLKVETILSLEPDFKAHQVDVAIQPTMPSRDKSLIVRKLINWQCRFVISPDYARSHKLPETPSELTNHTLLFSQSREQVKLRAVDRTSGRTFRLAVENSILSNGTMFVREATLAGGGIGFLPSVVVDRDLQSKRLIEVLPEYDYPNESGSMFLLYPATRFVPSKIQVFRDFIIEVLGGVKQMPADRNARRI